MERERSQVRTPSQGGLRPAPAVCPKPALWCVGYPKYCASLAGDGVDGTESHPSSAPDLPKPREKKAGTRHQVSLDVSARGLVHPGLSVGQSSAPSRGSGLEEMLVSVCGANDRRGGAVMRRLRAWAPNTANLVSHPGSELLSHGSWASSVEQVLWSSDSTNFSGTRRGGAVVEGTRVCGLQGPGVWCQGRGARENGSHLQVPRGLPQRGCWLWFGFVF